MTRWLLVVVLASCSYGPEFRDCEVQCNVVTGCPNSLSCGAEGLCRVTGVAATCSEVLGNDAGIDGEGSNSGEFVGDDLTYVKSSNSDSFDQLGQVVALSADGTTLAVTGVNEDSNGSSEANNSLTDTGAVYIFTRAGATWVQQAYIKASNPTLGDRFGVSIALSADGNTLAVGTPFEDAFAFGIDGDETNNASTDSGAAYVFVRTGVTWTKQAYIKASNTQSGDAFGRSIALAADGATLAVGATFEDSGTQLDQDDESASASGAAYVFTRAGVTWSQQAYLKASAPSIDDNFGASIALSGDGATLAVGAPFDRFSTVTDAGTATVFRRSGINWAPEALLVASTQGQNDQLGTSIALSGDGNTLAVGAPLEDSRAKNIGGDETDNGALESGAVYLFRRSGTEWNGEAYVKASNTQANDQFGTAVALSTDGATLVVGAFGEDSAATRIGGDQIDDSIAISGAGYVLRRSATNQWSHRAYVKASNPGTNDEFGVTVTVSGDGTVAAFGAQNENSASRGIDGDQEAGDAASSGAVYIFF